MGMPMHLAFYHCILTLMHKLDTHAVHQIWYADACACGSLQNLHQLWDDLLSLGPDY